jgi:hypothetical protein
VARGFATRFNIFSVAITAAATWSESTASVENGRERAPCRQVIKVSTIAPDFPPGGMRTL